jgi:hypothetical protein
MDAADVRKVPGALRSPMWPGLRDGGAISAAVGKSKLSSIGRNRKSGIHHIHGRVAESDKRIRIKGIGSRTRDADATSN